ncbi:hypothetical protein ACOSP7_005906 [Xanthoceras sorbifolium]|uniref:F-box associated beta-propeller type 1 domain-containing protein n=1 Tax=Xanthoceras sorbifolium TaxID=99658 RepID=A0ABQ8IDV4_9ROSI|nr:hypothetical protein JRO89_XS02G0008500 [Xanthoceras sorbifolium]
MEVISGNGDQNKNQYYQGILLSSVSESRSSTVFWSVVYGGGGEEEDSDKCCVGGGDITTLHLTKLDFPDHLDAVKPGVNGATAACRLSNSCHGLVCVVVSRDTVVIWNPSLQEYKVIPMSSSTFSSSSSDDIFGIGYDSVTDDYKIVRFPSIHCDSEHSPRNRIEVFSLKKTNSWKTIQDSRGGHGDFPYLVLQHSRAITVNGRPHWNEDTNILYFDASQECLGEMSWPETTGMGTGLVIESLQQLRGWLGVHMSEMWSHHELWIMKEYGVKESWTRLLRIPAMMPEPTGSPNADVFLPLEPFRVTRDGNVLLKLAHHGFFLYNPKNGTYKKFNLPQEITSYIEDIPYVESAVSPLK